jgi:outer membrane protein OmpA-like peptidoglycan-associated protein
MMKSNPCVKGPVLLLAAAMLLASACTTTGPEQIQTVARLEDPVEAVNRLGEEISTARSENLNILAPDAFAKAEKEYTDIKASMEMSGSSVNIFASMDNARNALQQAAKSAELSKTTIPDLIKGRDMARAAGATNLGEDYTRAEKKFLELTRAIERNDLGYAQKNQEKAQDLFRELEVRAVKDNTIGQARDLIQQAERSGMPKLVPGVFTQARDKLIETDLFITQNPRAKEAVLEKAAETLFLAKRVHVMAFQAESVRKLKPEQIALLIEDVLYRVSTELSAPDMRDQNFDTQVENVVGYIKSVKSDRQSLQDKIKAQQAQMEAQNKRIAMLEEKAKEQKSASEKLAAERLAAEERLQAQKQFDRLFVEVQNAFDKDEAEVYIKGNQCVIRLRGIRFPVGQAFIMPDNYALLSKVQQSIRKFNTPRVVIEGHTDSTGSNEVNELLSQQRAEAVRQYLVSNETLPADHVLAVGYGSVRPLADNASEEGRAANRRIDVILTPQDGNP